MNGKSNVFLSEYCKKATCIVVFLYHLSFLSCYQISQNTTIEKNATRQTPAADTSVFISAKSIKNVTDTLEAYFKNQGLVNIRELDSTIIVDLRYSTTGNFLGEDVYGSLENAFLQPDVAEKLVLASSLLKKSAPGHRLVVFDAVRPVSVQWKMWNLLKVPVKERVQYVSNPAEGSLHNYGAAVDLSILGPGGKPLDMATEYDHFGVLAFPEKEDSLSQAGAISPQQVKNRKLLRNVMYKAGFFGIQSEWWHFNSCTRDSAKVRYRRVE